MEEGLDPEAVVGEGSTQIRPNHSLDVQSSSSLVVVFVFVTVRAVEDGFGVADVVVDSS